AGVALRAVIAVVTGCAVGLDGVAAGARRGIAGARRVTLVGGRAHDRVRAHAGAPLAGVALRAVIAVVAGCAVGLDGVAAGARRRIAGAGRVALVGGDAHDWIRAHAGAALAGVGPGARVAVVAALAVRLIVTAASSRGGVAGAGGVALVARTHDRIRAHAD